MRKSQRGLLLAIGGRMPDDLLNGPLLQVTLVVRDVEEIEHRCAVTFWIERRAFVAKRATSNNGLFEPALNTYRSRIADRLGPPRTVGEDKIGCNVAV